VRSTQATVAGGFESEKRPYPPVKPISNTSETATVRAVHFLMFLATFRNFSNAVIQASPTVALQPSTLAYVSKTFAPACGTATRLLSASRDGEKGAPAAVGTHQAAVRHRPADEHRPGEDNVESMRRVVTSRGLPADRISRAALQAKFKPAPATHTAVNRPEHNLGNNWASNFGCDPYRMSPSAARGAPTRYKTVLSLPSWRWPCS